MKPGDTIWVYCNTRGKLSCKGASIRKCNGDKLTDIVYLNSDVPSYVEYIMNEIRSVKQHNYLVLAEKDDRKAALIFAKYEDQRAVTDWNRSSDHLRAARMLRELAEEHEDNWIFTKVRNHR